MPFLNAQSTTLCINNTNTKLFIFELKLLNTTSPKAAQTPEKGTEQKAQKSLEWSDGTATGSVPGPG